MVSTSESVESIPYLHKTPNMGVALGDHHPAKRL